MMVDHSLAAAVRHLGADLHRWSGYGRQQVEVDERILTERDTTFGAQPAPTVSRNGSCRLFATLDGWIAVNLPRPEDRDMVSALLGEEGDGDAWTRLAETLPDRSSEAVRAQASLLGLAVGVLGETTPRGLTLTQSPANRAQAWRSAPRVVDLSTLWAGPLCGALLAAAGCDVIRIDSLRRPDRTAETQPAFHARLNGRKRVVPLDLSSETGRDNLASLIRDADVVITSARWRGLQSIGLPDALDGDVIHVAITAHGLQGPGADRIGFGDDCAVAGGLVAYDRAGAPDFVADAAADPLTGAHAAACALRAVALREGGTLDVSLAATAAHVASLQRHYA